MIPNTRQLAIDRMVALQVTDSDDKLFGGYPSHSRPLGKDGRKTASNSKSHLRDGRRQELNRKPWTMGPSQRVPLTHLSSESSVLLMPRLQTLWTRRRAWVSSDSGQSCGIRSGNASPLHAFLPLEKDPAGCQIGNTTQTEPTENILCERRVF